MSIILCLLGAAVIVGGVWYWAVRDYWQEMPGLHGIDWKKVRK